MTHETPQQGGGAAQARPDPEAALPAGVEAPPFTLHLSPDRAASLADFRGRPVVLVFYPADFSPVCTDEMALFNEVLPELDRFGAQLFGVSVDGVWCHRAFATDRRLRFPLLADFEPKGEVARQYGVYDPADGTAQRALFVIDPSGRIVWSYVSPISVNPGVDGVLGALEQLALAGPEPEQPSP